MEFQRKTYRMLGVLAIPILIIRLQTMKEKQKGQPEKCITSAQQESYGIPSIQNASSELPSASKRSFNQNQITQKHS